MMRARLALATAFLSLPLILSSCGREGRQAGEGARAEPTGPPPASETAPTADRPTEAVPHPLSRDAYRAELRYLREQYRQIDLTGPPVRTDGWQDNIPEAEWPFMGMCYFACACCHLAQADPGIRDAALAEARYLIEALQTPRMTGFIAEHFGPPFGKTRIAPSAFVHGLFLQAAVRYREVSGDVDSGPVLFGVGLSASGFGIPAAAVNGDRATGIALLQPSVLAGLPEYRDGRLRYTTMPAVGQSVVLFGKAVLLGTPRAATLPPKP